MQRKSEAFESVSHGLKRETEDCIAQIEAAESI